MLWLIPCTRLHEPLSPPQWLGFSTALRKNSVIQFHSRLLSSCLRTSSQVGEKIGVNLMCQFSRVMVLMGLFCLAFCATLFCFQGWLRMIYTDFTWRVCVFIRNQLDTMFLSISWFMQSVNCLTWCKKFVRSTYLFFQFASFVTFSSMSVSSCNSLGSGDPLHHASRFPWVAIFMGLPSLITG